MWWFIIYGLLMIFVVFWCVTHCMLLLNSVWTEPHLVLWFYLIVHCYSWPLFNTAMDGTIRAVKEKSPSLRVRCTNVLQLWARVKSEFEPSSAVNCVAPKRFKHWSPFDSELPSDHRSNFDLGSTRGYACTLGNKYFLWYHCCKKLSDSNLILSKKLSRIEL